MVELLFFLKFRSEFDITKFSVLLKKWNIRFLNELKDCSACNKNWKSD